MPKAASPSCTSAGISAARWKTTSSSGMLLMRARYWRGFLRLTFMPHSARKAEVATSSAPLPGSARRISIVSAGITLPLFPQKLRQRRAGEMLLLAAGEIVPGNRAGAFFLLANDRNLAYAFTYSQLQTRPHTMPGEVQLHRLAAGTQFAGDAQRVGQVLRADGNHHDARPIVSGWRREQSQQTLDAEGKATGAHILRTADRAHQLIVAPTTTD